MSTTWKYMQEMVVIGVITVILHVDIMYDISQERLMFFCPQVSHRLLFSHNLFFMFYYYFIFLSFWYYFILLKHEQHNLNLFVNIMCVICSCCYLFLCAHVTHLCFECNMFMKYVNFRHVMFADIVMQES